MGVYGGFSSPLTAAAPSAPLFLAGTAFFTFRFFDIVKPPPANQLQRLRAGWGILVDDLVAGVYALIVTQIIVRVVEYQLYG